jgi:L-threonylcarbamoyladenylate synthase
MDKGALQSAVQVLLQGGVIAYPTEAVFGLGCDPANAHAVERILTIKQRPADKGLILIAAHAQDLYPYLGDIEQAVWDKVMATWPGPYTWLLPAGKATSTLLTGRHSTLAVRVTAHPVARALCEAFGAPVVSTSANLAGQPPATTTQQVAEQLAGEVDMIVPGEIGDAKGPTSIRDALTDQLIRGNE